MNESPVDLSRLSQLEVFFKELSNGKHINRSASPDLWVELEQNQETYLQLFKALGYALRIDGRGFAWFQNDEAGSNINKSSQQFALLFMVIFDTQADAGKPLLRFEDWIISRNMFETIYEQHQEVLDSEGLAVPELLDLLERSAKFGFARNEHGNWRLLPAVWRYLDHYEAIFQAANAADQDILGKDLGEELLS